MATKITRNLPNNAYQAAVNADSPSAINPYATVNELPSSATGNQLISGGASYSGTGMVFNVSVLVYRIAGIEYTTAATDVTLLVGDPSNPRFDAIVASIDANDVPIVEVVQGTPAGTPSTPTLEPDQVLVQYILVGTNATNPSITTEYIYRNDQSSDWQGSVSGNNTGCTPTLPVSADFTSSTPTPVSGAACCLSVGARYGITQARGTRFGAGTPVSREDFGVLSFYVNFPSPGFTQQGKAYLRVMLFSDNTFNTYLGWVDVGNYCDLSLMDTWQLVNIPTAQFFVNSAATTIGGIAFTTYPNICTAVEFALDEIKLQTGFGPQTNIATIDVFNRNEFISSTSKLIFNPSPGKRNNIEQEQGGDGVIIQLNIAGVDSQATAGGTLTPASASKILIALTGQDVDFTINTPTGSPLDGQKLIFRIKDDGTSRNITWGAIFEPIGVTLPTATTASKLLYIGCIYNADSGKWDVIAVTEEA